MSSFVVQNRNDFYSLRQAAMRPKMTLRQSKSVVSQVLATYCEPGFTVCCCDPRWLGPAGFASVVGLVRACMEGAASSKFGRANINDRLKILKDTILLYLFLTSFLPMHSMHCPTPCTRHASPTVPPARPMHVSRMH